MNDNAAGLRRWFLGALSIATCLLAWQVAATLRLNLGFVTFLNVPSPGKVAEAAITLAGSAKLWSHVESSLLRVLAGFTVAAILGVILGFTIGRSRRLAELLLPPLELLRPIPAVAWIPLAILMFPSSEISMIFITFTGALFPILLSTIHGAENVDPRLIAAARSLGASKAAVLREVILPGAAPAIVTGLAIGMGTAWFCLVSAELVSGQFGLGYYTWESYTIQKYPDIILGMILIGLLGMGSSAVLRRVGQALTPWHAAAGVRR